MSSDHATFSTETYAQKLDEHPYHNLLNFPALVSLMPTLQDLRVLDAGCGTGRFAEFLVKQGAQVTALDISVKMLEKTKARVPQVVTVQADLAQALTLPDDAFDMVLSSLSLQYLESWQGVFSEFNRILKPRGLFLFSVHHPFEEFQLSGQHYFAVEERQRKGGRVSFRRPLSLMTEALHQTGFVIEQLLEPLPQPTYAEFDLEGYTALMEFPGLLVIRAAKSASLPTMSQPQQ